MTIKSIFPHSNKTDLIWQANGKQKDKTRQHQTAPLGRTKRDIESISISH